MTIIWCMVPDMWSMMKIIFCHFLPFYPLTTQKSKFWKKMKKMPGDIILHKCTKNHDHMLTVNVWWMYFFFVHIGLIFACYTVTEKQGITDATFIHFGLFSSLLPPQQPKNPKFLKNEKIHQEISSFYTCVPKIMIVLSTVPEIWHVTDERTDRWSDGWPNQQTVR